MVLVILQHSYLSVNTRLIPHAADLLLWMVTHLAAIAFVSISGTVFTYFLCTQSIWKTTYRRYALRAVFLILVAHPAINSARWFFRVTDSIPPLSFLDSIIFDIPITDMIAVCVLVSPFLILRLGTGLRSLVVVTLWVVAPVAVAFLTSAGPRWVIWKEVIFGAIEDPLVFWWPLAPWLAIFLAGSFAGYALARLKQGELTADSLVRGLKRVGIVLALLGIFLTIGYKVLKMAYGREWSPELFGAIYPGQTTTLLPGYLAVLAGLFAALLRRIDMSGHYDRFLWFLSILGRTSLFTFVIQFAVVESVPALLGLKEILGLGGFIILFVLGLAVVWVLAYGYGRLRGWFSANDYGECVAAAGAHQGHGG